MRKIRPPPLDALVARGEVLLRWCFDRFGILLRQARVLQGGSREIPLVETKIPLVTDSPFSPPKKKSGFVGLHPHTNALRDPWADRELLLPKNATFWPVSPTAFFFSPHVFPN